MTAFRWGAATDTGQLRSNNQDAYLVDADREVFVVADGMGGHAGGEVASQVAVEAYRANAADTTEGLVEAVRVANRAVYDRAGDEPDLRGMGTTLCAIGLVREHDNEYIAVLNVGDSRVYRLQSGELIQITEDHSLVEDMVRQGRLTPEEARVHPQKNIVTRALGNEETVEVDSWEVVPFAGDRYLLASDGLFNEVDDDTIASTLRRYADPDETAKELVRLANAGGGRDNITVVVVDVVDDGGRAEQASDALAAEPRSTTRAPEAPPEEGGAAAGGAAERRPGRDLDVGESVVRHRRVTWRVVLFMIALLGVVVGGAAFTAWFARSGYFVTFDDDVVAIYQGRPGGVLWMDPSLERRTGLRRDEVPPGKVDAVEKGKEFSSLGDAEQYVANLREESEQLAATSTTTTTSTTSTTVAPPVTAAPVPTSTP